MTIDCADQLRKQAVWIYEALQPDTPDEQRIDLGDVDLDVLLAAADELDALRLRAAKAEGDLAVALAELKRTAEWIRRMTKMIDAIGDRDGFDEACESLRSLDTSPTP